MLQLARPRPSFVPRTGRRSDVVPVDVAVLFFYFVFVVVAVCFSAVIGRCCIVVLVVVEAPQ